MIIRPEQMRAFSLAAQQNFEERAHEYLCISHPDSPTIQATTDLREWIRDGIQEARLYKIISEIDVIRFLELRFTLGRDFHTNHEYAPILLLEVSAEERLDEIVELVRFGTKE